MKSHLHSSTTDTKKKLFSLKGKFNGIQFRCQSKFYFILSDIYTKESSRDRIFKKSQAGWSEEEEEMKETWTSAKNVP